MLSRGTSPHVFISYRREDSAGEAGRLYDHLVRRLGRDRVFRDLDALEPGVEYAHAIERVLSRSDVVIVVIGKRWLDVTNASGTRRLEDLTDLHRIEVATALGRGVRVVPVLVQGASVPEESRLPDDLKPLVHRNAFELSDQRWDFDVGRLVQAVHRLATDRPRPRLTPQALAIPVLVLIAVVLVAVAVALQPRATPTDNPAQSPPVASTGETPSTQPSAIPTIRATPRAAASPVSALPSPSATVAFNPSAPVFADADPVRQDASWTGSAASIAWMLRSIGRNVSQQEVVDSLGPSRLNETFGLMDNRGAQVASWLRDQGVSASNTAPTTFEDVFARAGQQPVMIGGAKLSNWVGVRGRGPGKLFLANPAPGYQGLADELTRDQWDTLGPWNMVWLP